MKILLRVILTLSALGALCFQASQVGAETAIEIRLTLVPAASLNPAGPCWTPCSASLASPLRRGEVVHAVLKRAEMNPGENGNARFAPVIAYTYSPPVPLHEIRSMFRGDEAALPTNESTVSDDDVLKGSLVLRAINGATHFGRHPGTESAIPGNSAIGPKRAVELAKPSEPGKDEVFVLPIKIPAQNAVVPHFRQIAIKLKVILPSEPVDAASASRVRYTFRSVPLEQLQPLPRANPVLKRARIPEESSAVSPFQP